MKKDQLLVGVDVGGTKIAAGIADEEGRTIGHQRELLTPEGGRGVVSQIGRLVEGLVAASGVTRDSIAAIGIAVPAAIDSTRARVLWAPNIPGWDVGIEVAAPVREAVGVPTSLHYDGHAWVMGEWWRGAASGARNAALVAVGTGIGGGLVLGGRLHQGRVGVAGALGWWMTEWSEGGSEHRPKTARLEAIASGPAIARAAGKESALAAFEAARRGDRRSQKAVANAAQALGWAIANLVSLVDPDIVVLAGGVIAGGADLLLSRVREIVRSEAQPQIAREVPVVAAELGEDAAWLGAGKLAAELLAGEEKGC